MNRIGRSGRYDPNTSTSLVVRTNLRNIREMHGFTRDQVIGRIEPPSMTAAMLAKVENGERSLSVEELVQLAVAYQVPVQVIVTPWVDVPAFQKPPLAGADYQTSVSSAQAWLIGGAYPPYPHAITRWGSALEGAASSVVFSNPSNLERLFNSPTPETYAKLIHQAIPEVFSYASNAVAKFKKDVIEWLGFDAFAYYADSTPTTENWRTPTAFREKLDSITDWTITPQQIVHFQHQYEQAMNLAGSIRMGFFTDDNYATVDGLEQYKDAEEKLREEIKVYQSIYLTIAEEHRKRRPGEDPLALDVLDPIDPNL